MGVVYNMTPEAPLLTGDIRVDIASIRSYLVDLSSYIDSVPDEGWLSFGTVERKVLISGDTLVHTQDVIATIVAVLVQKGILSAQ